MKREVKVTMILILAVLAAAGGVAALMVSLRKTPPTRQPRRPVTRVLAPAVEIDRDFRVRVVGYGSARPRVQVDIAPRVAGQIVEKSEDFFSGRIVRGPQQDGTTGQRLFRIDPAPFQLAVEDAREGEALLEAQIRKIEQEQANLTASRKLEAEQVQLDKQQLERVQALEQQGAGTQNEIDQARSALLASQTRLQQIKNQLAMLPLRKKELEVQLRAARIRRKQAELDLSYTTVRSPMTGRIIVCELDIGEQVQPGQVCGEMYGLGEMEIPVSVPAADLPWLGIGLDDPDLAEDRKPAALVEWAESGTDRVLRWEGHVERIEGGLEARTRTARLVVRVRNDPQQQSGSDNYRPLDRNMYCKVTILGRSIPKAFLLPRSALLGEREVYLIQDGRLALRRLDVARFTDSLAMILPGGGLKAGDRVILNYLPKPVLGMRIEPIEPADETQVETDLAGSNGKPTTRPAEPASATPPPLTATSQTGPDGPEPQ